MATLMQKDAIIEVLAGTTAQVHRYQDSHGGTEKTTQALNSLDAKRQWIYSTHESEIDLAEFIEYKTKMKNQFPDD